MYGAIGAFVVTALIAWLTGARPVLALAGGAFMRWMAWATWRAPVTEGAAEIAPDDLTRDQRSSELTH